MASTPHDDAAPLGAGKGTNRFRKLAASVLLAFALGLTLAFYLAWSTGWLAEQPLEPAADTPAVKAAPPADAELTAAAPLPAVPAGEMTVAMRVGDLERRLNRLDMQAEAASGNAARAEGLLVAFAARRLVERGAPLGYLENQLQLRFGNAQPNAVRTIINSARNPVTLDQLRQGSTESARNGSYRVRRPVRLGAHQGRDREPVRAAPGGRALSAACGAA